MWFILKKFIYQKKIEKFEFANYINEYYKTYNNNKYKKIFKILK